MRIPYRCCYARRRSMQNNYPAQRKHLCRGPESVRDRRRPVSARWRRWRHRLRARGLHRHPFAAHVRPVLHRGNGGQLQADRSQHPQHRVGVVDQERPHRHGRRLPGWRHPAETGKRRRGAQEHRSRHRRHGQAAAALTITRQAGGPLPRVASACPRCSPAGHRGHSRDGSSCSAAGSSCSNPDGIPRPDRRRRPRGSRYGCATPCHS